MGMGMGFGRVGFILPLLAFLMFVVDVESTKEQFNVTKYCIIFSILTKQS